MIKKVSENKAIPVKSLFWGRNIQALTRERPIKKMYGCIKDPSKRTVRRTWYKSMDPPGFTPNCKVKISLTDIMLPAYLMPSGCGNNKRKANMYMLMKRTAPKPRARKGFHLILLPINLDKYIKGKSK